VLALGRQAVNAGSQDGLHGGRDLQVLDRSGEAVGATLIRQGPGLDQGPHALLQEERIALGGLDESMLEGRDLGCVAYERLEQLPGALRWQRLNPKLAVVLLLLRL
jgi:hypothetical protein